MQKLGVAGKGLGSQAQMTRAEVGGDPTFSSPSLTENAGVYSFSATYSGDETESNKPPIVDDITISGTLTETSILTANVNDFKSFNNKSAGTHTYQWYRSDDKKQTNEITLGTNSTYTLVAGDVGKYIRVEVTILEIDGTNTSLSKSIFTNVIGA